MSVILVFVYVIYLGHIIINYYKVYGKNLGVKISNMIKYK